MAVRLPVIVSQAEARDSRAADIEQSLVAELIMSGGLDATLVAPLRRIQPESTDLLCLKGFSHDLALLSWMTLDEARQAWQNLGLDGDWVALQPESDDAQPAIRQASRRIYYLQLQPHSNPRSLCDRLRARLEAMRVKTVTLQMPKARISDKALPTIPNAASPMPGVPRSKSSQPATDASDEAAPVSTPQPSVPARSGQSTAEPQWDQLDQLVDDLDALDL